MCIMLLNTSPWDLLCVVDILSIFVSKKDVSLNLEYLPLGIMRFQLSDSQLSSLSSLIFPLSSAQNFRSLLAQFQHASFLQPGIHGMPLQLVPQPDVLEFLAQMNVLTARQTVTQLSALKQKGLRISPSTLKTGNLYPFVTMVHISGICNQKQNEPAVKNIFSSELMEILYI